MHAANQPTALPRTTPDDTAPIRPIQLLLKPSNLVVLLDRPNLLVGRHSEADIRLPLPDVSRRHCRFMFVNGAWRIIDLQSLNGIYVNGERLQQTDLRHGDQLRVGGFLFEVDLFGAVVPATPSDAQQVIRHITDALPAGEERRKAS
jgi:pSer/pThr/pTyr-binding forkhead associated (FHA) protein